MGQYLLMIKGMFSRPASMKMYWKEFIHQCSDIGIGSLGIVMIIAIFMGAVSTVQTAYQLVSPLIPKSSIAQIVRDTVILEFAPTLICIVLAGVVGSKIADSLWAVYASAAYVERHGTPARVEDLREHQLLGFEESMAKHRASQWLEQVAPQVRLVGRSNSVLGLLYAVKSGIGIAPLPAAIADQEGLVRVLGPVPELTRIWRVLAHRDRRHLPGVSALFDFLVEERERIRTIFSG